jgi:glycosidase
MPLQEKTSWFEQAVVYHLLIDRFAGYPYESGWEKPVFLGGNLTGIKDRLSYLSGLGVNTLWLSPVNKTTAYHGYHITDFFSVEPRFGKNSSLKELVDAAHSWNIRIILDFVPNHCSKKHPFFQQAMQDKSSPYRNWFFFKRHHSEYLSFMDFKELPKINLDYPDARNHLIGAATHWLSFGIDGFRLDHAIGPSHGFWKAFRREIKAHNAEAVLIGEVWLQGIRFGLLNTLGIRHKYLRWFLGFNPLRVQQEFRHELDGALDFHFRHEITKYIAWKENPAEFSLPMKKSVVAYHERFPGRFYLPTFIDNHDMNRFLFESGQDREKLKLAMKFQFSLPYTPVLYYGTETGLSHTKAVDWQVPYSDIHARKPMPWQSLDYELIDYCSELISGWKRNRAKT